MRAFLFPINNLLNALHCFLFKRNLFRDTDGCNGLCWGGTRLFLFPALQGHLCCSPTFFIRRKRGGFIPSGGYSPVSSSVCYTRAESDVNNTSVNMCVRVSLSGRAFNFLRCVPRSGIAGSCGSSVFNFLSNCSTVFYILILIVAVLMGVR